MFFVWTRHPHNRCLIDYNKALWAGFVLHHNNGTVYFAGDTGMGPHLSRFDGGLVLWMLQGLSLF